MYVAHIVLDPETTQTNYYRCITSVLITLGYCLLSDTKQLKKALNDMHSDQYNAFLREHNENGCLSEMKILKIDPKVQNRPSRQGLQMGHLQNPGSYSKKNGFLGQNPNFWAQKTVHF